MADKIQGIFKLLWAFTPTLIVVFLLKVFTNLSWLFVIILGYVLPGVIVFGLLGIYSLWLFFIYRTECPNCGTKNLRAGKVCLDDSGDEDIPRRFTLSQCGHCDWQFRTYKDEGEETVFVSPEDSRYWPAIFK